MQNQKSKFQKQIAFHRITPNRIRRLKKGEMPMALKKFSSPHHFQSMPSRRIEFAASKKVQCRRYSKKIYRLMISNRSRFHLFSDMDFQSMRLFIASRRIEFAASKKVQCQWH